MGAWTEIVDFTFTANETSRAFTGLNITKDDFIKIVITQVNGSSSESSLRLFPNTTASVSGFDTTTNYHAQRLTGTGSSTSAARDNVSRINVVTGSQTGSVIAYFKISENDKVNWWTNRTLRNDSSIENTFDYCTSSNLTFAAAITSLTFDSSVSNGIGTGSRIQIYRLDAVKEADITTTANATQVDISSLSIGKDSEYLLVSDIKAGAAGGFLGNLNLTVNDATTLTNYYSQRIQGSGSTASAARENSARYLQVETSGTLAYTHIKLSEIGAYTAQSYTIFSKGTSELILANHFLSSTSEAITSITKLNVVATVSDIIPTGSTFVLYKLK
jgi:hypothetical protein